MSARGLVTTALVCLLLPARGAADGCTSPLFRAPVRYATSSDSVVLLADLNGDGAPEILTSGNQVEQRGFFSLLPNRGDGTFANEQLVATELGEKLEDVSDLDGDGIRDLVASDYWRNGIAIHRGTGALQFSAGTPYATATHGGPTRAIDYDRDGRTDVVSFSFGSGNPVRIHLFRARTDGTFDAKTTVDLPLAIAASPSTRIRDGVPEVLVGDHSGHLGILRLAATGVSLSTRDAGPGFDLTSTFADVNGDGHPDIVDTNDGGSEAPENPYEWIFVTLATADGGFLERKQLQRQRRVPFPAQLQTGDFDGDGRLDLIAGDFRGTTLHYFRGDGAGSFADGVEIDAGGPVNDLAVGDLNGDRRPDLVTANHDGSVSVILNGGGCGSARRRAVRH